MEFHLNEVLIEFGLSEDVEVREITDGLINSTYKVFDSKTHQKYVLQRINDSVFSDVASVMKNIELVLAHLEKPTQSKVPQLVKTISGNSYCLKNSQYWRLFDYIEGSKTINNTKDTAIAKEAGKVIGQFHLAVSDLNSYELKVTLPRFHDLDYRLSQLYDALSKSKQKDEIDERVQLIESFVNRFHSLINAEIPIRITHNDTKLSNILFDQHDKAICLIDLDTLMPGYIHHDYGDALRTLATSVDENEKDVSLVHFDLKLFASFTEGYLGEVHSFLTPKEREGLALSIPFMPYIMAIRFLTDYLNGNTYYKVDYPHQNLDRTDNQFALMKSVFSSLPKIESIIQTI